MQDIQIVIKYFLDAYLHIVYLNYLHYEAIVLEYAKIQLKHSFEQLTIFSREIIIWVKNNVDTKEILRLVHVYAGYLERADHQFFYTKACAVSLFAALVLYAMVRLIKRPRFSRTERMMHSLIRCRKALANEIRNLNCQPIMLRLAFSDVQTYDKSVSDWAIAGGSNGSIRFDYELNQRANVGLSKAIEILKPFKSKFPQVSWADLIQMAGALAVELTGGPKIDMRYGRIDVTHAEIVGSKRPSDKQNNVARVSLSYRFKRYEAEYNYKSPCALPPYPNGALSAEVHLRNLFYRMGLTNRDIVAIMGSHTLGRAFHDRSGVCEHSSGEQGATIYTRQSSIAKITGEDGVGMPGGCSWTKHWLSFDNSYYSRIDQLFQTNRTVHMDAADVSNHEEGDLLWLPTDQALYDNPEFHLHFVRYARDQSAFFHDYAIAHKKMSELGAKFEPVHGIQLEDTS